MLFRSTKENDYLFISDNSKSFMWAGNLIKSDIRKSNFVLDVIDKRRIQYYGIAKWILANPEKPIPSDIVLIDINSAYPTTLLNSGAITPETFARLQSIPKLARLKSIGALATNKVRFEYHDGKLTSFRLLEGKEKWMEAYYYYCALKVGETIFDLSQIYPEHFLFFWFDGIYFTPDVNENIVQIVLKNNGYGSKVQRLHDCEVVTLKNTLYFGYKKEGEDKKHYFHIPIKEKMNFLV
mgnify:CR=1 FL=1